MMSLWSPLKLARIPLRSCQALYHSTPSSSLDQYHGTTIICIRKNGKVCMMGDGQVSQGNTIVKPNAQKLRVIGGRSKSTEDEETTKTLVGFAGSTADAFTLVDRLESRLEEHPGQLMRSAVELAKGWRTDRYLRRLEASLLVADSTCLLEVTGNGDVLESNDGILGVGSGSPFAIAAARALMEFEDLSAEDVARRAMRIASDMCVYTNDCYRIEILDCEPEKISNETK